MPPKTATTASAVPPPAPVVLGPPMKKDIHFLLKIEATAKPPSSPDGPPSGAGDIDKDRSGLASEPNLSETAAAAAAGSRDGASGGAGSGGSRLAAEKGGDVAATLLMNLRQFQPWGLPGMDLYPLPPPATLTTNTASAAGAADSTLASSTLNDRLLSETRTTMVTRVLPRPPNNIGVATAGDREGGGGPPVPSSPLSPTPSPPRLTLMVERQQQAMERRPPLEVQRSTAAVQSLQYPGGSTGWSTTSE